MTWPNPGSRPLYPPQYIAYAPGETSIYDAWQRPEVPSLDTRLALEKSKAHLNLSSSTFSTSAPSPGSIRSFIPSRFKKSTPTRDTIQQARQHNNELVACQLPQNVYERVFLECAQLPVEDLEEWTWFNVSYVCRKWRNAALGCRRMWAFIDFTNPGRTAVSLNRAKGEPFSIRATVAEHNVRQLKSVLNTAYRIEDVCLHSSFNDILPLLETLTHPNPTLTSLIVDVRSHSASTISYPQPNFPLFGQQSRLRTVELISAPLYLLSYHCPALTRLTLRNLPSSEHQSDLHRLLSSVPHLLYLTVCDCDIRGEFLHNPVFLPNLRRLKIEGSLQQVADFLNLVTLPAPCQFSCSLNLLDNLSDSLWRLCQFIGTHSYSSSQEAPLETLALTGNEASSRFTTTYEPNPDFRQSIRVRAFGHTAKPSSAIFDITIGPGDQAIPDDTIITTLIGIWRALFLTGIQTLSLQNIDIITQKTWGQFLRTLPQLRILDIRGYAPSGLVWALLLDVLSSNPGAPRFLVPRLDDVYLYGVDCSSGGLMLAPKGQMNSHTDVDDSSFLDVFEAALRYRRRNKMGLRSLTITRCGAVVEERLTELRLLVSHLIWDLRGKVKEKSVRYRNMHQGVLKSGLRHYNRLEALLS